ncbi:hypothetical protein DFQ27_009750 [Actinomortierella ambigua]|uniref:Uncharacterized protein n=1 Tax=Actinomortierella ambigua TaxID=1343610 RepID=A0A9P6QG59_9FUNG|nr:hypothetical protein DFQ27_009750 [Actinomortierella ambigua]
MKVLLIATCLALASIFVTDGASVPLAAVGSAPESANSREELSHSISELASRAAYLNSAIPSAIDVSKAGTPAEDCSVSVQPAIDALKSIQEKLKSIAAEGSPTVELAIQAIELVITSLKSTKDIALDALIKTLSVLGGVLEELGYDSGEAYRGVAECLRKFAQKDPANPGTKNALASPQKIYYLIADLYRSTVDAAIMNAASVPEGSCDEIKRSMTGILAVLDITSESSIAANNADLLKVEPIFAADMLEQFRDVYVSLADKDEQELFAAAGLSLTIGASNTL